MGGEGESKGSYALCPVHHAVQGYASALCALMNDKEVYYDF